MPNRPLLDTVKDRSSLQFSEPAMIARGSSLGGRVPEFPISKSVLTVPLRPRCGAGPAELSLSMARYLARRCPQCKNDWGVFIAESKRGRTFRPIHGLCAGCGYEIAWALIVPTVRAQIPWDGNWD
jgi:hypothetical protein